MRNFSFFEGDYYYCSGRIGRREGRNSVHEKMSADAAPRKPKKGAISSPLNTADDAIAFTFRNSDHRNKKIERDVARSRNRSFTNEIQALDSVRERERDDGPHKGSSRSANTCVAPAESL